MFPSNFTLEQQLDKFKFYLFCISIMQMQYRNLIGFLLFVFCFNRFRFSFVIANFHSYLALTIRYGSTMISLESISHQPTHAIQLKAFILNVFFSLFFSSIFQNMIYLKVYSYKGSNLLKRETRGDKDE